MTHKNYPSLILRLGLALLFAAAVFVFIGLMRASKPKSFPSTRLADGRILQIEGVSFGTNNAIGSKSMLESVRPWLPRILYDWLSPKYPHNNIELEKPGLVVWVNAKEPVSGKHVDCQGIRVEFMDKNGDLLGEFTHSWFGGSSFWRVGHIFYAFPRTEPNLTLLVTPWNTNVSTRLEFPNPHVSAPEVWTGSPLPQHKLLGNLEVTLARLNICTNGGSNFWWQTPSQYWKPAWELRRGGNIAATWDEPDWTAEDPSGNRGQFLGAHQPVLRFSATFYPKATNVEDAVLLATSPLATIANLQSNIWWKMKVKYGTNEISVLGLFTNGTHVFSEGVYQTNPPARSGPISGGAPSGWISHSQRVTPTRVKSWSDHYTPMPVIYICAPEFGLKERLALRLRDSQGRYWAAKLEEQGNNQGVKPFLLDVPPEVKTVTAEILVLRPVSAEFQVQTPAFIQR